MHASDRLPATAYLLTGCVAILGSNSLVLAPIAPEVAHALESSTSTVMAATAAFGLGTAASALLFARHIDRLGAWRVLQMAMAALAAALLLSSLAPYVVFLVAAQVLAGLATGVALPAIYASAAAIAPPGRESRTIGVVLTGWTLSLIVGVSFSAVLADIVQWRAVYAAVAVLAVAAFVTLLARRHSCAIATESAPMPTEALKIPGVTPLLIACGVFSSAFYGIYGFLGDHLHNDLSLPLSANGLAALAYGLAFGSATLFDKLLDRLGAERTMPLGFLAASFVYFCMALVGASFRGLLATVFLWGLANHIVLNTLIMRLTALDPARRGTIMGLNSAATYLAVFAGTTGFGVVYANFGFVTSAVVAAGLTLISLAGVWQATRSRARFGVESIRSERVQYAQGGASLRRTYEMFKSTTTFASFSVDDLQKAKEFYATTLGIPIEEHMPGMMTLKTKGAGDVNIFLKKHHVPATSTVLNFVVHDIAKTMEELSKQGITFEHYDGDEDIFTDEKGVAEAEGVKASWFKDPAGNLLQLLQMPEVQPESRAH